MNPNPKGYKAYILRIWQAVHDQQPVTLASIEDSQTGQRKVFADLAALLAFLETVSSTETIVSAKPQPADSEPPIPA